MDSKDSSKGGNITQDIELQSHHHIITTPEEPSTFKRLGFLDRFLAVWILLAMVLGVLLGNFVPGTSRALNRGQFLDVSVPITTGLLVMMYPILCKIKFESLGKVFKSRQIWYQIGFSVVVNWIVAPLFMVALAWAFLSTRPALREGLILVGVSRCIAMVLIWTSLADADVEYCAILVAVNSLLQMVLYSPLAYLFLTQFDKGGHPSHTGLLSYKVVSRSVAAFLGIPLAAAIITRFTLRKLFGPTFYDKIFLPRIGPLSLIGLLYTIIVLFASQGHQVVHQILSVLWVAAPLLVYFTVMFGLVVLVTWKMGMGYKLASTQALTAASNNFELAIAVAVATFGPNSDQALAATVGPLVEVPVLVGLVYVLRWMRQRYNWKD